MASDKVFWALWGLVKLQDLANERSRLKSRYRNSSTCLLQLKYSIQLGGRNIFDISMQILTLQTVNFMNKDLRFLDVSLSVSSLSLVQI